jgi:type II secretory pathway pseudopilin PulG
MIKYILLIIFVLALVGGYMIYNYIIEKKNQLIKIEKKVDNSTKIPPTETPPSDTPFVTVPDPKNTKPEPTDTPLTPLSASDSKIIEYLKLIATAQDNYESQTGRYSVSLKNLDKNNPNLKKIITSLREGSEWEGYVFKEITNDKDSEDTRSHYGFLANPATNQTGKSFLLIMDLDKIGVYDNSNNQESDGIDYYESTTQGTQLKSWPTPTDLSKWKHMKIKSNKTSQPAPKVFEYNNADDEK